MSINKSSQNKFIQPLIESNEERKEFKYLSPEEKVEMIKLKYNLNHGKGKRKRKNSKKK